MGSDFTGFLAQAEVCMLQIEQQDIRTVEGRDKIRKIRPNLRTVWEKVFSLLESTQCNSE